MGVGVMGGVGAGWAGAMRGSYHKLPLLLKQLDASSKHASIPFLPHPYSVRDDKSLLYPFHYSVWPTGC